MPTFEIPSALVVLQVMKRIYLDANGSMPPSLEAQKELVESVALVGNPSSFHEEGRNLRTMIDEARTTLARAVNFDEEGLVFTSGASEANRWFVDALKAYELRLGRRLLVVMSPYEHPSLLKPMQAAHESGHFDLRIMEIDSDGRLVPHEDDLRHCDVFMCAQAHNETGILTEMEALLSHVSSEAMVMSDTSQALARVGAPCRRVDFATFSAQKMGGYAGLGGFAMRDQAKTLRPPWAGGGQERGFRPGTESFPLIMALKGAASVIEKTRRKHHELLPLRDYFEATLLLKTRAKVLGQSLKRLPNTSAITFYGQDPDALRIACDITGLSVGFGSACSGLAPEGSFALKRLGLSLEEEKTTIRFSFCVDATKDLVDEVTARMLSILR